MDAIDQGRVTTMEAAMLRSRGLPLPVVTLDTKRWQYTAVIVRPSGKTIEAIGPDSATATERVVRLALQR